ncbi:hypothetical protein H4R35_005476, partial [Dimargaris xerosporica]
MTTCPLPTIQPNHLAYILYTSGSTGQPKGVMIEHHSLATLAQQVSKCTGIQPGSRHLQMLALTFDCSLGDVFLSLCHGATLVLSQEITEQLAQVDSTIITPSLLAMLDPLHYPNLTTITVAGEALPWDLATKWSQPCVLINAYGPTENTVFTTCGRFQTNASVTIGRPFGQSEVYILDARLKPVPVGVVGELYIGGGGLMRGYVNRPDLDQAVLVPHPFHDKGKLYKTGDRGRWLVNGEIDYVGRKDDQVKVSGRRVEPAEIESVLCQHPNVAKAAVVVADNQLVAFISPAAVTTAEVLLFATQRLPTYMAPVHTLALATLPLTTSGKIDRKQLRQQAQQYQQSLSTNPRPITKPRNLAEKIIVESMAQVLLKAADAIDVNDSFFAMGGDSLRTIKLVSLCRERRLYITVADVFQHATPSDLAQLCGTPTLDRLCAGLKLPSPVEPYTLITLDDKALKDLRDEAAGQLNTSVDSIIDIVPTSSLQNSFIVNTLKDPSAYMVQMTLYISGPLDLTPYRECWLRVGQRHSILRTKFITTDTVSGHSALQVVLSAMDMAWSYSECDQSPDDDFDKQFFAQDRQYGFAFDGSPLIRAALFKVTDTDHRLFFTIHHALLDAWTMTIVLDEVMALYHGQSLAPVIQFNCYLAHLVQRPVDAAKAFWSESLSEVKPTPDLQLPRVQALSGEPVALHYATHHRQLACPLSDINAFCQQLGITVNNLLRGVWALLLSRYLSESDEVTFGVMVSGRNVPLSGIDDMAGLCINTVPFRAKLNYQQPLHDWLRYLHHLSVNLMAHEHASLVDIQRWAKVAADTPLFQSLLVFDKYRKSLLNPDDHQVQCHVRGGSNFTEYPLTASFAIGNNSIQLSLDHDTAKYDAVYIAFLSDFINHCLTQILQSSTNAMLSETMHLPESELTTITAWSQGTTTTYDPECTLLQDSFLRNIAVRPDAVALESSGQRWTYAQMHQQALTITHWLLEHNLAPSSPVALIFTRSPEYVFAVLGVLIAGRAYVPIDAQGAIDRTRGILDDLDQPLVLSHSKHTALLEQLSCDQSLIGFTDDILKSPPAVPLHRPAIRTGPHDLVYIIYTSGTTGKPKGAMMHHASVLNILQHIVATMGLDHTCRGIQTLNIAFDVCVVELFATFLAGGTVVLGMTDLLHDLALVNTCHLTSSLLSAIDPHEYPNLTTVANTGEALPLKVGQQWSIGRKFFNCYGPTETSITSHTTPFDGTQTVHVGPPIPNTQTYIVNEHLQLVPIGVPGQVCIAGAGVGNGYWKRPDLTSKAFIDNPFGPGKLYLSGDMGCWLSNGNIKIIGRQDFQVKLRGFRIELGELESVAQAIDSVTACAAIVKDGQLVLYTSPLSINVPDIRAAMIAKLPSYMHPEHIIALDQLPLTTNGKINRRALEALSLPEVTQDESVDPSTISPTLRILQETLAAVLAIDTDRIQPNSSFFRLGGDSISAIQFSAKCKRRGLAVTVAQVLQYPILEQLEQHVEWIDESATAQLTIVDDPIGPLPLTAIQRWFLQDNHHYKVNHFNQSFSLQCREELNLDRVCAALTMLISHHDGLRTRFVRDSASGEWLAEVVPTANDLQAHAHIDQATLAPDQVDSYVAQLQTSLCIETALNVACALLTIDGTQVLFIAMHHLVVDLVSWRIILEDLEILLTGQALPPKSLSFRQWAHQAYDYAQTLSSDAWPTYDPVDPIPLNYPVATDYLPDCSSCQSIDVSLGSEWTEQLFGAVSEHTQAEPQDFMIAALALAFKAVLGVNSFELDLESHGRHPWSDQLDVSRTVGWFTSLYPVSFHLLQAVGADTCHPFEVLRHIKQRIHAMPNHGLPYGLLKYRNSQNRSRNTADHSPSARRHIMFNYVGRFDHLTQTEAFWQPHSLPLAWSHDYSHHEPFNLAFVVTCMLDPAQGLTLSLMYSTELHTSITAQHIANEWQAAMQSLVECTQQYAQPCLTLCDFKLLSLNEAQFDQLLRDDLSALAVNPSDVEAIYPCTPLQEGMLLALASDPKAYFLQLETVIHGSLDVAQFQAAWQAVIDRHTVLRTRFLVQPHCQSERMLQVVAKTQPVEWTINQGQPLSHTNAIADYKKLDVARGFRPAESMLRFGLFTLNDSEHRLILSIHHALIDGWSLPLLFADVLAHYNGRPLTIFGDYQDVVQYSMTHSSTEALDYWRSELAAVTSPCYLPSPLHNAPTMASKQFAPEYFETITRTIDGLEAFTLFIQQRGITMSTLLRAAIAILLQYYTNQAHVVFGTTISGRNVPVDNIEHVIGPCITTIPCHAHIAN